MPLLEDLVTELEAKTVGAFGTSIFCSSKAIVPQISGGITSGATLLLVETGGTGPENTQNRTISPAFINPGVQLVARANSKIYAERLAWQAYVCLVGIRNKSINGNWYRSVKPLQQPRDLGLDDKGQIKYGFNVLVTYSRGDIS